MGNEREQSFGLEGVEYKEQLIVSTDAIEINTRWCEEKSLIQTWYWEKGAWECGKIYKLFREDDQIIFLHFTCTTTCHFP